MDRKILLIIVFIMVAIMGCSNSDETAKSAAPSATPTTANTTTNGYPNTGKVIRAMHGGGYTYMLVENGGREFWIASTMMNVKRNDTVSWADAAIMKDFKSSTLRRTFDEILFVTAADIEK